MLAGTMSMKTADQNQLIKGLSVMIRILEYTLKIILKALKVDIFLKMRGPRKIDILE